jgi:transcriptional regulator with XRE-family HTH domain
MLGERIGVLRRARGLSQAELARRLKISASAMGMYEQGRREPSAQTLVALAKELQVSTDFLLTGAEADPATDPLPQLLEFCVEAADRKLDQRPDRPFSRQELATLFAALLME